VKSETITIDLQKLEALLSKKRIVDDAVLYQVFRKSRELWEESVRLKLPENFRQEIFLFGEWISENIIRRPKSL